MTTVSRLNMPVLQFFDDNGDELNGGTLTFTTAGTSTAKDTYADSAKATTNPNPITLDSAGRPDNSGSPIQIWLEGSYKLVVKDSSGNTIRTEDNINSTDLVNQYAAKTGNYTVTTSDDNTVISVDATSGNLTVTLLAAATAGAGFTVTVHKSDSSSNTVTVDADASELIDGATTNVIYTQYDAIRLVSTGTAWFMTGEVIADLTRGSALLTSAVGITVTAGDVTLTSGDLIMTSGDFTMTSGNALLTSGTLTMTAGDFTMTAGNQVITVGNLTLAKGDLSVSNEDARTTTTDYPLSITSTTTGTPAAGIGTGVTFYAESADENPAELGTLDFNFLDVTAGSEDSELNIQLRAAGAAASTAYTLQRTGTTGAIITHANTSERTYTLSDNDALLGSAWERIGSTVASASASIEVSLGSQYIAYMFVLEDILPATDGAELLLTFSNDAGSTYLSTNYRWVTNRGSSDGTGSDSGDSADSSIQLALNAGASGTEQISGTLHMVGTNDATYHGAISGTLGYKDSAANAIVYNVWGHNHGTLSIDQVKFAFSTGNIASGRIAVYALRI